MIERGVVNVRFQLCTLTLKVNRTINYIIH
jgi:hypothetical protein